MQVYSVGHLCLSITGIVVVLVIPIFNIYVAAKMKKYKTYEGRKSVSFSFCYMLLGVCFTSMAFDPPHQTSQRTDVIECVLIPIAFIALTVPYLIKHRLPKKPMV